jgi:outer membrane protein assembly factor BamB
VLDIRKFLTRRLFGGALVAVTLLFAACGPAPLGTSWPAVSLFTAICGDQSSLNILVAYTDRIVQVNPADGKPVVLKNAECQPRPPNSDGKDRVWDFRPAAGKQFYTTPLQLDDQTMLAMAYDQHFYRIDTSLITPPDANGVPINGRTGNSVTDLVASDDLLYVGLSAKDLVAVDKATYDVQWTATTEHGVWSKPLLVDETLYFSSLDHNLYAVDAKTGEARWTPLDLDGAVTGTPLYADGKLYIGSFARKIFEISTDGQILNQFETDDWVWGTPSIQDGILYAADLGGNVYALDTRNNLTLVWKQKVAERAIRPSPVIAGNVLIVASRDHKVYWLNRSDGTAVKDTEGNPLMRELEAEILSDILLIRPEDGVDIPEPYIVVSTTSPGQLLAAYTLDNGQLAWSYKFQ